MSNTYIVLFILSKMAIAIDVLKYRAIEGYAHLAKYVLLNPLCSTKTKGRLKRDGLLLFYSYVAAGNYVQIVPFMFS